MLQRMLFRSFEIAHKGAFESVIDRLALVPSVETTIADGSMRPGRSCATGWRSRLESL